MSAALKTVSCEVLVVEDNPGDAYLIRHALHEALRCNVIVIDHGGAALSLLCSPQATWCPSLVVLDLNLPAVPGQEILKQLRARGRCPGTPVIICTSSTREDELAAVRELGVSEIVAKGIDLNDIRAVGLAAQRAIRDIWPPS